VYVHAGADAAFFRALFIALTIAFFAPFSIAVFAPFSSSLRLAVLPVDELLDLVLSGSE